MYEKIILIGNLGGDPEMRYMQDGTSVTNFSLATNRKWTDRVTGDKKEETCWWRVSVWGRQAETANEYLSRGSKVLVEGRMNPDPQSGGPRMFTRGDSTVGASYELRAFNVRFLDSKEEGGAAATQSTTHHQSAEEEDEIPF